MAYTILVCEDNSLYGSHKERVMQRSKLMNTLVFIVNPIYNGIDMTNATVMLEYVMPVSREYKTVLLALSDERYNDCFLQYKLPFDVDLTSQAGSLEVQLTFAYVEMMPNGIGVQRVRKTSSTTIDIIPITAWSDIIPDAALSSLDQRLIKLDASMRAMNDYLDVLDSNKVDNIMYDKTEETIQLSSNGVGIGDKVSVREMLEDGVPVVNLDSDSDDNSDSNNNDGCDCGCEDNIVEFSDVATVKPNEDNNVVEF
jgi:hypothetical protein